MLKLNFYTVSDSRGDTDYSLSGHTVMEAAKAAVAAWDHLLPSEQKTTRIWVEAFDSTSDPIADVDAEWVDPEESYSLHEVARMLDPGEDGWLVYCTVYSTKEAAEEAAEVDEEDIIPVHYYSSRIACGEYAEEYALDNYHGFSAYVDRR